MSIRNDGIVVRERSTAQVHESWGTNAQGKIVFQTSRKVVGDLRVEVKTDFDPKTGHPTKEVRTEYLHSQLPHKTTTSTFDYKGKLRLVIVVDRHTTIETVYQPDGSWTRVEKRFDGTTRTRKHRA